MLDRSQQPPLHEMEEYTIQHPVCQVLPNGVKLYILDTGDVEITRIDLVFDAGKQYQDQVMQALFANRMLREGTRSLNRAEIASRSLTRADLALLRNMRNDLQAQLAADDNPHLISDTYVAIFDGR